ncbi:hypothetical protein CKW00_05800 [Salimicrobium humidisoli]|uniref:Uncharacterized protein n=1 Tax=Salimicrobium humidisoli TaxID=2029857 RepID=A0ABX4HS18_9BACI|nr:hypothetical protein CKW00_05800 [Salimicrobium humidisoli]
MKKEAAAELHGWNRRRRLTSSLFLSRSAYDGSTKSNVISVLHICVHYPEKYLKECFTSSSPGN